MKTTVLCALPLTLALFACGDDGAPAECGPGDATDEGLEVARGADVFTFGGATSSPNNDCPAQGAPTSLTIQIAQIDTPAPANPGSLILCVPRPDDLGAPIQLSDSDHIQVIDVFVGDGDCRISLDRAGDLGGTVTFGGVCENGVDIAGYSMSFDATVPATRSCAGSADESVELQLSGDLAVSAIQT